MIGKFLLAWHAAQAPVTAILGSSPLRLWPGTVPQDYRETFPRATFQQITSNDLSDTLEGPGILWQANYQIDYVSKGKAGYGEIRALELAVIGTKAAPKLHKYSGTLGGVTVKHSRLVNAFDGSTPPDDSSDNTMHTLTLEFQIAYLRA